MKPKRILAVILAVVTATLFVTSAFAATFNDVPEAHPFRTAIDFCHEKAYVKGVGKNNFMPNSQLTRGQLAVIWSRVLNIKDDNPDFTDITRLQNYYDASVIVMHSLGMLSGTSETKFSPNSPVTREQLALLAMRTYQLGVADKEAYKRYNDHELISEWARDGISSCINADVFEGLYDKENFEPQKPVTRGEICKLIYNVSMPSHTVTIAQLEGGTITASPTKARAGTLITLTVIADEGKQLKAGTLKYNDTVIEGTTFAMPPEDVLITAEFEEAPVKLESLEITKMPDKTSYIVGEALNLNGLVVKATYSNGETAVAIPYTVDPAEGTILEAEGTVTVKISYTENGITKSTEFEIEVTAEAS